MNNQNNINNAINSLNANDFIIVILYGDKNFCYKFQKNNRSYLLEILNNVLVNIGDIFFGK